MKYEELRQYLKKNPYCFRTMKEREEEINNKIMEHEGRRIIFAQPSNRYHNENFKGIE
ncbi:MAG TPA: hypothetical protein GXZ22_02670 [Clostridiaceae bacterium]|nr:hypothetical protein [Clostridiaceae bacterium]